MAKKKRKVRELKEIVKGIDRSYEMQLVFKPTNQILLKQTIKTPLTPKAFIKIFGNQFTILYKSIENKLWTPGKE